MIQFGDTVTITAGPFAGRCGTVILLGDANAYPQKNPQHDLITVALFVDLSYVVVPSSSVALATLKGGGKLKAVIGGQEVELNYEIVTSPNAGQTFPYPYGEITSSPVAEPKCDCGAVKCKTTHTDWCSTRRK